MDDKRILIFDDEEAALNLLSQKNHGHEAVDVAFARS